MVNIIIKQFLKYCILAQNIYSNSLTTTSILFRYTISKFYFLKFVFLVNFLLYLKFPHFLLFKIEFKLTYLIINIIISL